MSRFLRRNMICLYVMVLAGGLATGIARGSACDGNWCEEMLPLGCGNQFIFTIQSCCKDLDGDDIRHCVDCRRTLYYCPVIDEYRWSPGYACQNAGAVCN